MRLNITQTPNYFIDNISFSFVTATEDINQEKLSVYPNPANNQVNITGMQGETTIELFNSNGSLVKTVRTQESNLSFSIESLSDGIYLLKCLSKTGITSQKIIESSNLK